MLVEWEPDRLWYMDTRYTKFALTHIQRMVIIKLNDGSLVIHNPIELTTSLQKELSLLGNIRAVICSSPSYHQFLSEWWLAYSQALFYATPTLIQKRSDLHFDGALSHYTEELWKGDLLQGAILGSGQPRKMIFCDPKSRTLILSDNLMAVQPGLPLGQKIATWAHGINQDLRFPYTDKRQITNMALLRASIQEIMTWPFDRLLATNGLMVEKEAKRAFYQAFWWAF